MNCRASSHLRLRVRRPFPLASACLALILLAVTVPVARAQRLDVYGSGNVIDQERPVHGIHAVNLLGIGTVRVEIGDEESLVIRADANLMPYITTEVSAGMLRIGSDANLHPTREIEYFLSVTRLERAELYGAGEIVAGPLSVNRLDLRLVGAGALRFHRLTVGFLDVLLSGVGDIHASGGVDEQRVVLSGVGDYLGPELDSAEAGVTISGIGTATVRVRNRLRAVISGTGTIRYIGSPRVDATITGRGEVIQLDAPPSWQPTDLGDGWRISSPEDQGVDSAVIERIMELAANDPRLDTIRSLLMVRHGTLVAEGYFNGWRPERTGEIRSATKSVTSLLVGIALEQRLLGSVDQPLIELLPAYADLLGVPEKRALTLSDALTMRLGLRWEENSDGYWWDEWPRDLVRFTLRQDVVEQAGTRFRYSTGTTQLLAEAVVAASGRELHTFAEERLFLPLGIDDTSWMRHDNGRHYGGVGLFIRPRDMAKIGQLVLQKGRWQSESGALRQVVPEAWIRESTENRMVEGVGLLGGYGYQWWVDPEDLDCAAIGHGGQLIAVFPDEDAVVVITADPNVGVNGSIDIDPIVGVLNEIELDEVPGRIGFKKGRFTVVESHRTTTVPVFRQGGADGAAEVMYEVVGGTALAGQDFGSTSGVLRWRHGEAGAHPVRVPLLDDDALESEETFEIRLRVLTGSVSLGRATTTVAIEDDEKVPVLRPGRLRFESEGFSGAEGDAATVIVERLDGADGEVSVRWQTDDRSAAAGFDYEAASGLLTWADGDSVAKSFEVVLLADGEVERGELLDLRLFEPTGGVELEKDDAAAVVAVLDHDGSPGCAPGPELLCLNEARFRVEAEWHVPRSGKTGFASVLASTDDTGMLWFFDPENVELIVKILDGRRNNDAYWLFYGGLSDVEYWIIATDTLTGETTVYHNRPGSVCGEADIQAFPMAADSSLARDAGRTLSLGSMPASLPTADAFGSCEPSEEVLCLLEDRLRVEVTWHDPRRDVTGTGKALPVSDESGTFWFFDPANIELVVKALDARPNNGRFWFFYGAVTDLEYWITVTDTVTGAEREYHKPRGNLCGGADIEAFE